MATPQLEDGFTRIANEILEAIIMAPFNATQQKIILLLLRRSYGFNRKSCQLSISFIEKATGLSGRGIRTELNALIKTGVINVTCEPTFNTPRELSFQKDYTKWSIVPQDNLSSTENSSSTEELQQQSGTTVPRGEELQLHSTVEAQFHSTEELQFHQERKIKDNIKKDIKDSVIDNSLDIEPPKPKKKKYGSYDNVLFTDEEYAKLKTEFPKEWQELIDRLSEYMAGHVTHYKNHLAVIRSWWKKDNPKAASKYHFEVY